jgi:hypothetical protein
LRVKTVNEYKGETYKAKQLIQKTRSAAGQATLPVILFEYDAVGQQGWFDAVRGRNHAQQAQQLFAQGEEKCVSASGCGAVGKFGGRGHRVHGVRPKSGVDDGSIRVAAHQIQFLFHMCIIHERYKTSDNP